MIIHNGLFAEYEVLENFQGFCGPRTRTCTCSDFGGVCVIVRVLLQLLRCNKIKTAIGQDLNSVQMGNLF